MLDSESLLGKNKKQPAFTIIEVVLVLAVAGLIFLVVFAAIPRLQASRRDNQRKRDAEAIIALAIEYKANVGSSPSFTIVRPALGGTDNAFSEYASNAEFQDPSGGNYFGANSAQFNDTNLVPGEFYYHHSTLSCHPNGQTYQTGQPDNSYVFIMRLERGVYCIDGLW